MSEGEMSSAELQQLLKSCSSVQADLNLVSISLRRRQLTGAHQCAKATIELIRSLIGRYNFSCADQMMKVVRAFGRELMNAAPSELTIGNLVRRVLFFIREEYVNQMKETGTTEAAEQQTAHALLSKKQQRDRSNSMGNSSGGGSGGNSNSKNTTTTTAGTTTGNTTGTSTAAGSNSNSNSGGAYYVKSLAESTERLSLSEEPQLPVAESKAAENFSSNITINSMLGNLSTVTVGSTSLTFMKYFPGLKSAVISAINELNLEIDNVTDICQRAQDHIHADECILTYGYSRIVEQFLKAAAAKRKFQLIIAESNPRLDGHKLAQSLSKVSSISITLVPDSNIYALMARVNKVILCPQAVMADGGAICPSGHLMVSTAAKELSVPVVCVAGAFTVTPLFAHNQSTVLNQLLSPADALPYNANINTDFVEVNNPAFDFVPPDLIALYVTNDGSQLPSYVFRQLSEYYHPDDYYLM